MGALKLQSRISVEEYLRRERASRERHEYLDGQVSAMAGETGEHGDITMNIAGILWAQLKGTPCRARVKDTKVRSGKKHVKGKAGLFSYPDIVVICGDPEYHDEHRDVIVNPKAIIEVLSESTEAFDRGEKFTRFQKWNPTLSDYVLVSQTTAQVEHFSRQKDGKWSYELHTGLDAVVRIKSIGCTLNLAEVYDRIRIPTIQEEAE